MDEKELEEQQKQAELDEASKKTAHVAGKALATYYGGAKGAQIYDMASKTQLGQDIENTAGKALQKNPIDRTLVKTLNDSGALDAAEKGLDAASKSKGGAAGDAAKAGAAQAGGELAKDAAVEKSGAAKSGAGSNLGNLASDSSDNDSKDKSNSALKKFIAVNLAAPAIAFVFILFIVVIIVAIYYYPVYSTVQFFKGVWNKIVSIFTETQAEVEAEYYQELSDVQDEVKKDYNICIDVNLITASLTVNRTFEDILNEDQVDIEEEDEDGTKKTFKKMKKQVKLLANMQLMRKKYGLDEGLYEDTDSYCIEEDDTSYQQYELINSENLHNYKDDGIFPENGLDSSTYELIARHDLSPFGKFFTRKANEERNYAYYFYRPYFDDDGDCDDDLPDDEVELSIGDYATRKDSVYYWNLVNSFIPEYYDKYLPDSGVERDNKIIEIADNIYSLYDQLGPSQTCSTFVYTGPSALCPNGVTIEGVGTYSLEEYIAGVVSREAYSSEGMEALKAQAVAARTYALKRTNYCSKSIANSTSAQTFTKDINDRAREASFTTAGEILVDSSGNIFSSEYDSFCYQDKDCPDAVKNPDGSFSVTYTRLPNGEKHTIVLNNPKYYSYMVYPDSGHARGMSQLVSYQLANEGKNYREILAYFYSDGVQINSILSPSTTEGSQIIQASISQYLAGANLTVNDINQYIYSNVKTAGVSTRQGVVAAATSLITGINSKTGFILPYELKPSGKYSSYGVDPEWGTNTDDATYTRHGLDCSGFISWAVHNGGYEHVVINAKDWGNQGTKREWNTGVVDNTAQPGDLIYNAPRSENGTSGHIRMIIGVTNDGYVVAEAGGRNTGVRITNISFTSTGSYYLVDMTNYYNTATKVNDYPM